MLNSGETLIIRIRGANIRLKKGFNDFIYMYSGSGTGQGLHIVKKIMTSINGTIDVSSVAGKGTIFNLKYRLKDE